MFGYFLPGVLSRVSCGLSRSSSRQDRNNVGNKKQLSLYVDRDMVLHVKILLLQRDNSPSLSQLVENLLNFTIIKTLEGDEVWLREIMKKNQNTSGE